MTDYPQRFTNMETIIRHITSDEKQTALLIKEAADILRKGGLVVFPTETVYGIGADAFNEKACSRIFEVKKRPESKPLIVLISHIKDLENVVKEVPDIARPFIEKFWPGPLSIVFKKNEKLPETVTACGDKVAVRLTSHPFIKELISETGFPLVAPSANISGNPSKTKAEDTFAELKGLADMIIEGDESLSGKESTIIDVTGEKVRILREGAVNREALETCCLKEQSII